MSCWVLFSCARTPLHPVFVSISHCNHRKPSIYQGVQRIISPLLPDFERRGGWGCYHAPAQRPIPTKKNFILMKQYEALKIKYRYEAGGTWCLVNDGGVIVAAFSSKNKAQEYLTDLRRWKYERI